MNILFAGTPVNAAHTLEAVVGAGYNVVGVLTREDALVGRGKTLTPSAVAVAAKRLEINTLKANRMSQEVIAWIADLKPDLGVIVAYGSILKLSVLSIPEFGWINLHYSLLPKYPGAAPVQHAIMSGEMVTGVTIFRLDEGIDTGPILNQADVEIDIEDSSGELLEKLSLVGSDLLIDTLSSLDLCIANQRPQQVPTGAAVATKTKRSEAKLSFTGPALVVHNLVRAMNPEPTAWFELESSQVRVIRTSLASNTDLAPGEGKLVAGELLIGCTDEALKLLVVQPSGKNKMSGADWFRGLRRESILIL